MSVIKWTSDVNISIYLLLPALIHYPIYDLNLNQNICSCIFQDCLAVEVKSQNECRVEISFNYWPVTISVSGSVMVTVVTKRYWWWMVRTVRTVAYPHISTQYWQYIFTWKVSGGTVRANSSNLVLSDSAWRWRVSRYCRVIMSRVPWLPWRCWPGRSAVFWTSGAGLPPGDGFFLAWGIFVRPFLQILFI